MTITLNSVLSIINHIVDILLVWLLFYYILKNIKNNVKLTLIFKGVIFMIVLKIASDIFNLVTIGWLLEYVIMWGPLAIIIIFQPEIRAVLEQLGRSQLLGRHKVLTVDEREKLIYEIVQSMDYLRKAKIGALIIIERDVSLSDYIEKAKKIYADITSDCAPLNKNIEAMLEATKDVHVIRDATRGGVGTVLYEIAAESNVGISLDSESIPVQDGVRGVCQMLGLEPLYLACEGRLVIFAPASEADKILEALHGCPNSEGACIIGEVTEENVGKVILNTAVGAKTFLARPSGELLPRIC